MEARLPNRSTPPHKCRSAHAVSTASPKVSGPLGRCPPLAHLARLAWRHGRRPLSLQRFDELSSLGHRQPLVVPIRGRLVEAQTVASFPFHTYRLAIPSSFPTFTTAAPARSAAPSVEPRRDLARTNKAMHSDTGLLRRRGGARHRRSCRLRPVSVSIRSPQRSPPAVPRAPPCPARRRAHRPRA